MTDMAVISTSLEPVRFPALLRIHVQKTKVNVAALLDSRLSTLMTLRTRGQRWRAVVTAVTARPEPIDLLRLPAAGVAENRFTAS